VLSAAEVSVGECQLLFQLKFPSIKFSQVLPCVNPENYMHALSLPTWIIHVSTVLEWAIAIWLIAQYGKQTQNSSWRWFALAMTPALVSAMCACTWHFFDNNPSLDWLVTLQAAMTLVGNTTLAIAAYNLGRTYNQA